MAGSLNKVMLIGNLGRDPEIRSTADGRRIANFSIATSEQWKDRNSGEKKERTEWHRIVVFNEHLVPIVEQYVRKGSKVMVEGALQTRKWTDQQNVERYSTEIVLAAFRGSILLLGDGRSGNYPPPADSADQYGRESTRQQSAGGDVGSGLSDYSYKNDLDDDIPFATAAPAAEPGIARKAPVL